MTAADRVHAGAAVLGGDGDAEQAELAAAAEAARRLSVPERSCSSACGSTTSRVKSRTICAEHPVLFGRVVEVGFERGGRSSLVGAEELLGWSAASVRGGPTRALFWPSLCFLSLKSL